MMPPTPDKEKQFDIFLGSKIPRKQEQLWHHLNKIPERIELQSKCNLFKNAKI